MHKNLTNAVPGRFGSGDEKKYGDSTGWVGIHALDMINFVTDLEFAKISAMESKFFHPQSPTCQDNCGIVLAMSNGGHAVINIDLLRPESAPT
jgi:hypothetical protein